MPRPIHFELPADDPERAVRFYENVFGWKVQKWDGPQEYWLITTGEAPAPGIDGAIMRRDEVSQHVINTLDVPDLDAYIEKVTTSGGRVVVPKMEIPGVGWFAYAADPEGNVFGMMQGNPGC